MHDLGLQYGVYMEAFGGYDTSSIVAVASLN
jgi:hypothetical protein